MATTVRKNPQKTMEKGANTGTTAATKSRKVAISNNFDVNVPYHAVRGL